MQVGKRVQASQQKESLLGSEAAGFAGARPYLLPGSETKATISKYVQGYSQKQVLKYSCKFHKSR